MSMNVLILSDDLMFTSQIASYARDLLATTRTVRTVDAAIAAAGKETPGCVIVDWQVAGQSLANLLTSLGGMSPKPFVVAYGSHVDTAGLRAAQEAGCDLVVPRSKFVEILPVSLAEWLKTGG